MFEVMWAVREAFYLDRGASFKRARALLSPLRHNGYKSAAQ